MSKYAVKKIIAALRFSEGFRRRLRSLISWLAVGLGCLVGFAVLALCGMAQIDLSDPEWPLKGVAFSSTVLFGGGFLLGSLVALRNRRKAGIIFFTVMAVAAFCLACSTVFYWTVVFVPWLAAWSVPFLLFGSFWLKTGKRGWPGLMQFRLRSPMKRAFVIVTTSVSILLLGVVFILLPHALGTSLFNGDCRCPPLLIAPRYPGHAVFTAKVLFAGRSIHARIHRGGTFDPDQPYGIRDRKAGDWAIGIVQDRFWGMPGWTKLVLLTNYIYWEGETYFVDGGRNHSLLAQFLPIVRGGIGCSRTMPIQDAIVDLRVLRNLPPATGDARIIGYVRGPEVFRSGITRPRKPLLVAGAQINVTGPAFARTIATDSTGVYELDDLAPGDYTLRLQMPDTQTAGFFNDEGSPAVIHIRRSGSVAERNFELFWDGRIEGQVKDDTGKPASASVNLVSDDGRQLPGNVDCSKETANDGSFQFRKVPPGRYLVIVNANGPHERSPYDLQYYSAGARRETARVFDLAAGRRITGIDFKALRLPERSIQVRVTSANGSAAAGAHVCIAYEGADDYDSLTGRNCIQDTDQNGLAAIRTYGRSQVRIFAYQFDNREGKKWSDQIHSRPGQFAADQTPERINLVLIVPKP